MMKPSIRAIACVWFLCQICTIAAADRNMGFTKC